MSEEAEEGPKNEGVVDEDTTITLRSFFETQEANSMQEAEILEAAERKKCSYTEGYLKRQELFSCLTCIPEAKDDPEKAGGVCLSCAYHCHEGHNLISLYAKRNFRCDCGNSKFAACGNKCILLEDKTDTNELNRYNQNFSGTCCVCHHPYTDLFHSDDSCVNPNLDEMTQCIICEDWYHNRHLGVEVPEDNNFAEMTCELCVTKHEFMLHYDALAYSDLSLDTARDLDTDDKENKQNALNEGQECKKPKKRSERATAKLWREYTWREQLCSCDECLKMYKNEDLTFLLDQEDPMHRYQEKKDAKSKAYLANEVQHLINTAPRVAMLEIINGVHVLQDNLGKFLSKFDQSKETIQAEDVKEFFEGLMRARKKAKVDYVQHNCG